MSFLRCCPKKHKYFFKNSCVRVHVCMFMCVCLCARACVFLCVFVLCVRAYFTCVQTWSFCLDVNEIMHACMHNYGFSRYIGSPPKKMVCTVDGKTAKRSLQGAARRTPIQAFRAKPFWQSSQIPKLANTLSRRSKMVPMAPPCQSTAT